jgi:sugar phosphate isomerase/epimerase
MEWREKMSMMTRRSAIAATLAGAGAATAYGKKKGMFEKPLGLQLYTLRFVLPNDADNVLKTVSEIGFKEVEVLRKDMWKEKPLYDKYGLKPVSAHVETPILTKGPAWPGMPTDYPLEKAIEDCGKLGMKYIVAPYVMPKERGDLDYFRKFADDLNRAGEQTAKAGITLCYHNHAFEFKGQPGSRVWDVMVERFDKKYVQFELDVFWVSVAGLVPIDVIKSLSGRLPLIHLKDKGWGTPTQFDESVKPEAFKEVGAGTMEFPPILRACEKAGVKHYLVEQDQTPKDPLASIRLSYTNLRNMKIA